MKAKIFFLTLIFIAISSTPTQAGVWTTDAYKGLYGERIYKVYTPSSLPKNTKPAVVVMLHGCEQNADDFAVGTRIEKWADKDQFIALFPEQNKSYNSYKCWNWILPGNNGRMGESQVIIEMLDAVITKFGADKSRVFAAGMSAGASMVNILANCYPERFSAVASHDGSQFYASFIGLDFQEVVKNGASVPSSVSANIGNACSQFASNRPKKMPVIIFHSMNTPLMSPMHALQVESEYLAFNDLLDNGLRDNSYFLKKDVIEVPAGNKYGYTLYRTFDTSHDAFIERYMINDLVHSWSGGASNLLYNDPKGPDASMLIFKFFKKYGL
jgi:poly(hydroxyalkanoate) depolymerase family esterase